MRISKIFSISLLIFGIVGLTLFFQRDEEDTALSQMVFIPSSDAQIGVSRAKAIEICKEIQAKGLQIPIYNFDCDKNYANARDPYLVFVEAYYIDIYEVTFSEYVEFLNALDITNLQPFIYTVNIHTHPTTKPYQRWYVEDINKHLPAMQVTKQGAETFCAWKQKRLPSEAEWELAARGHSGNLFPWGNELMPEYANICNGECLRDRFHGTGFQPENYPPPDNYVGLSPVGSFPNDLSEFGVYDMAGNVSEWVSDRYYSIDFIDVPSNKNNPTTEEVDLFFDTYVYKGGSYEALVDASLITGRVAVTYNTSYGSQTLGFRCAKSAK